MDVGSSAPSLFDTQDLRSKESCKALGLECGECVKRTARNVAAISPNISSSAAHTIFSKAYPDACCATMERAFVRACSAPVRPTACAA